MSDVLVTTTGAVTEIRLARPAKKNAMTQGMYAACADALEAAHGDDGVAVVAVSGEGDAFCAGNDLADFMGGGDFAPVLRFLDALAVCAKPLVAAVQGPAVGVGATMLLHCDLVFAEPDARFTTPFAQLGLTPEGGSSRLLAARLGHARAFAMLALGAPLTAQEALEAGFVNAVTGKGEARAAALAAAAKLASAPRAAILETKRLMRGDVEATRALMREEAAVFRARLQSEEAQAAIAAFFARRKS